MDQLLSNQLEQTTDNLGNLKGETEPTVKDVKQHVHKKTLEREKDFLIIFLASELYSFEWVKQNFPEFYNHCLEEYEQFPFQIG